jgi:hypothetical protein
VPNADIDAIAGVTNLRFDVMTPMEESRIDTPLEGTLGLGMCDRHRSKRLDTVRGVIEISSQMKDSSVLGIRKIGRRD